MAGREESKNRKKKRKKNPEIRKRKAKRKEKKVQKRVTREQRRREKERKERERGRREENLATQIGFCCASDLPIIKTAFYTWKQFHGRMTVSTHYFVLRT